MRGVPGVYDGANASDYVLGFSGQVSNSAGNVQTSKNIQLAKGINFNNINDELKIRANRLADILASEFGMKLVISSGYRSAAEQAALLKSGRGHRTAQLGRSPHQYGRAFDVAINSHMIPQFRSNKKAMQMYNGNFNAFWNDMVRRAGLYRFDPVGDPFHHALPRGTQYGSTNQNVPRGGGIWGAPEGDYARQLAMSGRRGRQIKGWGTGPERAQPHNFTTSPLFAQFVNRTARENGVDPNSAALFLNMILNVSAMGESKLGSAQIGFDPKDKGTFQIRDSTFSSLRRGIGTFGRGLDGRFLQRVAGARDVFDLTTEEQAILSLVNAASVKGAFRNKVRQGAAAVASGNMNAIRQALVDYIYTLHWAGGNPAGAIQNMNAAIASAARSGKRNRYGVGSGQEYVQRKLLPLYTKQANDFLNYISRGR